MRTEYTSALSVCQQHQVVGVYMGWVNPKNPVKPTQKKSKKVGWVGSLGEYGFKKCKTHKKNNGFWAKPNSYLINPLTK